MGREPLLADKPIIGPIWVRLRDFARSLWLVPRLHQKLQTQADVNQQVATEQADQEARLVAQDKAQADLRHDLGELSLQVIQLRRRLAELEHQLAEKTGTDDPDQDE